MNKVILIGRLTKDPVVSYSSSGKGVARFNLALNRGKDKDGKDLGADYPSIVCFGRTAELAEKYLAKGRMVAIEGKVSTGSYEKDGKKVYTTDIQAEKVEFIDSIRKDANSGDLEPSEPSSVEGFSMLNDEDIPF